MNEHQGGMPPGEAHQPQGPQAAPGQTAGGAGPQAMGFNPAMAYAQGMVPPAMAYGYAVPPPYGGYDMASPQGFHPYGPPYGMAYVMVPPGMVSDQAAAAAAAAAQGGHDGRHGSHGGHNPSLFAKMPGDEGGILGDLAHKLGLDDKEFWKGALVGAAVVLLLTNQTVKGMLFKTAANAKDSVLTGAETLKEKTKAGIDAFKSAGGQTSPGKEE